jgi:hypothetical protein
VRAMAMERRERPMLRARLVEGADSGDDDQCVAERIQTRFASCYGVGGP